MCARRGRPAGAVAAPFSAGGGLSSGAPTRRDRRSSVRPGSRWDAAWSCDDETAWARTETECGGGNEELGESSPGEEKVELARRASRAESSLRGELTLWSSSDAIENKNSDRHYSNCSNLIADIPRELSIKARTGKRTRIAVSYAHGAREEIVGVAMSTQRGPMQRR